MYNIEEEIRTFLETNLSSKFNKFYTGKIPVEKIPTNYMPILMVYGTNTELLTDQITTARDKYAFTIVIEAVIDLYQDINAVNGINNDGISDAQKRLKNLVEERDSNMKPKSTSILGQLRSNVTGTDYLFSHNVSIEYENENIEGTTYLKAIITMENVTRYNNR